MRTYTPLWRLKTFDYTHNVTVDAMHNLILGVCKKVFQQFMEGPLSSQSAGNLATLATADALLKQFRTLYGKHDSIRSLKYWKRFTASEWLFVIRYGIPLLELFDIPPSHLRLMATAFYMTLKWTSPVLKSAMLPILHSKYLTFLENLAKEVEMRELDLNYHIPVHYAHLIKLWGPLTGYWCWGMERQNQILKRLIDGGNKKKVEGHLLKSVHVKRDLERFFGKQPKPAPSTTPAKRDFTIGKPQLSGSKQRMSP